MEIRRVKILDEFKEHGVKKKSKLFILPMLCDNVRFGEFSQYFVDINISIEKMYIYVLLDNTYTDEGLRNLVYKLENHYSWISSDYVDDNEVLMLSFNVIKEYSQDYKKFIDGKYSEFSDKYKQQLLKIHDNYESCSTYSKVSVYDALHPSEKKRAEIAKELGVEIKYMSHELFDPPNILYEEYMDLDKMRIQLDAFKMANKDI